MAGEALDDGVGKGTISWEDREEVARADAVMRGQLRETGQEVYLVAEVSPLIELSDVERAVDGARRLSKMTGSAVPVVAGERLAAGVMERCRKTGTICITDGQIA